MKNNGHDWITQQTSTTDFIEVFVTNVHEQKSDDPSKNNNYDYHWM